MYDQREQEREERKCKALKLEWRSFMDSLESLSDKEFKAFNKKAMEV